MSCNCSRCSCVRFGAAVASTPIVVFPVPLTVWRIVCCRRGRYTSPRVSFARCSAAVPIEPIKVFDSPGSMVASITISGKKTPAGAFVAVRPSTATFTSPPGTLVNVKLPCASVKTAWLSNPTMNTFALAIGFRNTSSGVCRMPSAPALISSKVIGLRSGPGSNTRPMMVVPGMGMRLTVENVDVNRPPGVPLLSASSAWPSAAPNMVVPSTCTVIVSPPGIGLVKNSQAKVPSCAGTMVAASLVPVESVA